MAFEATLHTEEIMPGGYVKLPKAVRKALRLKEGKWVGFVVEGKNVKLVRPREYSAEQAQKFVDEIRTRYAETLEEENAGTDQVAVNGDQNASNS